MEWAEEEGKFSQANSKTTIFLFMTHLFYELIYQSFFRNMKYRFITKVMRSF